MILYSTKCPKCKVLETKLKMKNIPYEVSYNIDELIEKGIMSAPVLEVNGEFMLFADAIKYVNGLEAIE